MNVETKIALVDDILTPWKEQIGHDFAGYMNHVHRVLNFCFALHQCSNEERHKLVIAGAFHDLGIGLPPEKWSSLK